MKYLGKLVELNDGLKVFCTWTEIYKLCGLVREDFLFDTSGECLISLIESLENKGEL